MSIRLMAAIFDSETLGPTERLIMLALADHADDAGRCYPSMARLARRTGLSERAIQTNVKKLTDAGYLKVIVGGGKSNANVYFVSANPAADAPFKGQTPQQMHPAGNAPPAADAPQTPQQVRTNPAADAPEPSRTIIKPSEIPLVVPQPEKPIKPDKHRLPENWALSDKGWAYARSQNIPDEVIRDEALGFHAYWSDRTDAGGKKSAFGWEQCWATRCRTIAGRYAARSNMAGGATPSRYGQGSSIASIVARRRAAGEV